MYYMYVCMCDMWYAQSVAQKLRATRVECVRVYA